LITAGQTELAITGSYQTQPSTLTDTSTLVQQHYLVWFTRGGWLRLLLLVLLIGLLLNAKEAAAAILRYGAAAFKFVFLRPAAALAKWVRRRRRTKRSGRKPPAALGASPASSVPSSEPAGGSRADAGIAGTGPAGVATRATS